MSITHALLPWRHIVTDHAAARDALAQTRTDRLRVKALRAETARVADALAAEVAANHFAARWRRALIGGHRAHPPRDDR